MSDHRALVVRPDFRRGLAGLGNGAADQGAGLPRYLWRVGSKPRRGDGGGARGGGAGLHAGERARPWLAAQYFWPGKSDIDAPLVAGAGLFGIGWGLVGLCPGPALESLATLSPGVIVFVVAMAAGCCFTTHGRGRG